MSSCVETIVRRARAVARRPLVRGERSSRRRQDLNLALFDPSAPLPPDAKRVLRNDNPALRELEARYAICDRSVRSASRWSADAVEGFLDLRYFRGETLITWHYREEPRITQLKYYILLKYVESRDALGLLGRLEEDGTFGCWTFSFSGLPRVSRDLLDSVNEISYLERQLELGARERFSVLDIGAGYGRLAHRMSAAYQQLSDYCCVDAVAKSSFLCDYYLRFRGVTPPARVVPLDRVDADLEPGGFDLAVNVHSFSECPLAAIEWWVDQLRRLRVPRLLVVPNDGDRLLSLELGGARHDFRQTLAAAGYRLIHREHVLEDPAVRELLDLRDQFHLFALQE